MTQTVVFHCCWNCWIDFSLNLGVPPSVNSFLFRLKLIKNACRILMINADQWWCNTQLFSLKRMFIWVFLLLFSSAPIVLIVFSQGRFLMKKKKIWYDEEISLRTTNAMPQGLRTLSRGPLSIWEFFNRFVNVPEENITDWLRLIENNAECILLMSSVQ